MYLIIVAYLFDFAFNEMKRLRQRKQEVSVYRRVKPLFSANAFRG